MSKFNTRDHRAAPRAVSAGPLAVADFAPTTTTYEGAPAYTRTPESELFLLAVSNMVGEDTFYERADDRDARFQALVAQLAVSDPVWLARLLRWLRGGGNMRSASLVGAVEMVRARLGRSTVPAYEVPGWDTDRSIERVLIGAVCQRADEPGELLAYAMSVFGRRIPMVIKKGVADAAARLYTERNLLKYDTGSHAIRFADVIELTHPTPTAPWQDDLFRYAIERRHGRATEISPLLGMVQTNAELRAAVAAGTFDGLLDQSTLAAAGMTWEDTLSLAGDKVGKAKLWSALIPQLGIMAAARNLRNIDQAGVNDQVAQQLAARFADAEQVARSRMFPFRWLSAYREAPSLRWSYPLEQALQHSLSSVPAFAGRTLVLLDTSGSMTSKLSGKSKLTLLEAGAVFAVALAAKGEQVDLHGFADGVFAYPLRKGASVIREVEAITRMQGRVGHGTNIVQGLMASYAGHDRVIVFTDEQTMCANAATTTAVPKTVPMYCFNLAGYRAAAGDWGSPNRVQLGGLTDATFRLIPTLEAGRGGNWSQVFGD